MGSRRTMILIAAVVVGAIAAFALYTYIGGIEDEANENAERVEIYKVVQDIPKGFFGDEAFAQGYIERDRIPREFRPGTAVVSEDQVAGLVAINSIPANQVITTDMFTSQQESLTTFASLLSENQVAVTVSVDEVRGVANLLVPGDVVNLMVLAPPVGEAAAGGDDFVYSSSARYVYQKVQILAIGQTKALQPGETAATNPDGSVASPGGGLITFAVPPEAAQRIASVGSELYLTLVPRDYQPQPLPPLPATEPLPGEDGARLTPYGPEGLAEE